MVWPFRRRPRGKHALGAPLPVRLVDDLPGQPRLVDAFAVGTSVTPAAASAELRVHLGFRDGSTQVIDPSSDDARVLIELAERLRSAQP